MAKLQSLTPAESLAKLAYKALLASIFSGELNSGVIYNEMALAKELGISRTPVREALLELSGQGLVTFLPRKGITINHFSRQDMVEIFEIRRAIESAAVGKVAELSPPLDLKPIEKTLSDQRKAAGKKDLEAFLAADRAFHILFCELTGNRRMKEIMENVRNLIHLMSLRALRIPVRVEAVLEEHEGVIEAVKQGDAQAARKAILHHLEVSERAVIESLRD